MGFAFGEEYGAEEDEPTGEEDEAGLAALEAKKAAKAKARQDEIAAANNLAPLPDAPKTPAEAVTAPRVGMGDIAAQLIAQALQPPPPPPPAIPSAPQPLEEVLATTADSYMNMVEKRLSLAAFYRVFTEGHFFDIDCEEAQTVEDEVKAFARERLGVLLNINVEKAKPVQQLNDEEVEAVKFLTQFSRNELRAIKILATKMLLAGALEPEPEPAPAPQPESPPKQYAPAPKPLAARPAPAAPAPARPSGPKRPQLIQRQAPTPLAGVPAPAPSPAAPVPASAAGAPAEPHRGRGRPPGAKNKPKLTQMVPAVIHHPDGSEEELFNDDGTPKMVPVQRIQRPAGMLPMPTEGVMQQLTEQQAAQSADARLRAPGVMNALKGLANTEAAEE